MAAAYAAVLSLMHTIDQIQHHPQPPPVSLNENQVQFLSENLTFLQEFLEDYYSHGRTTNELADGLVSCIADAAYAAEDVIELRVVDQILSGSTSEGGKEFENCLQKVVDDLDLIKKDVMKIKETITPILQVPLHRDSSSSRVRSSNVMVGFDDALSEIMDKLTDQEWSRQIIPIVGMGGIGKTTLARNVYSKLSSSKHFDVCAWTTISQNHNVREFCIDVLSEVSKGDKKILSQKSDGDLEDTLHKYLFGRRYLIIMDDIWSVDVWDEIKLFLPDCENGSRVVATTRLSNFASQVNGEYSYCLKLKFLDDDQGWNLFRKIVFGEEVCPRELEEIGKKIAKGCKGLPLSISVIGGLLAKSKFELEYWGYVAANLSSVVNLENNEECSKILEMSYSHLPTHLKPCFLHVGVFPEDEKIRVSMLIELWIVEGFLKPICGKSMEVVAREYVNDLVDRNLVLVREFGVAGNIKYCSVHDLLRDFCLREAQRERFCYVLEKYSLSIPQDHDHRRVVVPGWNFEDVLLSTELARSLYYHSSRFPPSLSTQFLRILKRCDKSVYSEHRNSLENMFDLVNLRYIDVVADHNSVLTSSLQRFWNLSSLMVDHYGILGAPSEIWNMLQLRHVKVKCLALPYPPYGDHEDGNDIVLGNLQTLSSIANFICSEEIIQRIPNLKKLKTLYSMHLPGWRASCIFLNNIENLCKLESLYVAFTPNTLGFSQYLTFPNSLKKLSIDVFVAGEFLERIGSLPHLVKLKLMGGFFDEEREWVTLEGQFTSLRFLLLEGCYQLEWWKTESSHFPCLQHLALHNLKDLKEIPSDIGEISTLELVHVKWCSQSVVDSAWKIKEEQEELGNESLQVRVEL